MSNKFRLIACPSISHERRMDRYCTVGRTLGDYLHDLGWQTDGLHARVTIDGDLIPEAEWMAATPKPGQSVIVRSIPQGGGNGQSGKQAVQIAAMLALTVASIYVGGEAAALRFGFLGESFLGVKTGTLLAAGLLVGGTLAMNARIISPLPRRALTEAA